MSRMSPATEALATIEALQPGSPCTFCGAPVHFGAVWPGRPGEAFTRRDMVFVCPECVPALLRLALDALADRSEPSVPAGGNPPSRSEWLEKAEPAFDDWQGELAAAADDGPAGS